MDLEEAKTQPCLGCYDVSIRLNEMSDIPAAKCRLCSVDNFFVDSGRGPVDHPHVPRHTSPHLPTRHWHVLRALELRFADWHWMGLQLRLRDGHISLSPDFALLGFLLVCRISPHP